MGRNETKKFPTASSVGNLVVYGCPICVGRLLFCRMRSDKNIALRPLAKEPCEPIENAHVVEKYLDSDEDKYDSACKLGFVLEL